MAMQISIFSGIISIPERRTRFVSREGIGFPPLRIDKGENANILAGTQGELLRVDGNGTPIGTTAKPFPAPCVDGVCLDDRWVGVWLDREFGECRMAALPLDGEWLDGPSREELRLVPSSGGDLRPAGSIWSRTLDAEPMKMGRSGEDLVFTTASGMYMVDKEANEIWREELPLWPEISRMGVFDKIICVQGIPGGVVILSQAGGVVVIDPSNGSTIFSKVLDISDKIAGVSYSEVSGWMMMMHGGSLLTVQRIEEEETIVKTPGPALDAVIVDGEWRWTGWRHDGILTDGRPNYSSRDGIGVGIIGEKVLTNDGFWGEFGA